MGFQSDLHRYFRRGLACQPGQGHSEDRLLDQTLKYERENVEFDHQTRRLKNYSVAQVSPYEDS